MKRWSRGIGALLILSLLAACAGLPVYDRKLPPSGETEGATRYVIGISQPSGSPIRVAAAHEIDAWKANAEATKGIAFDIIVADAGGDPQKQVQDVRDLLAEKVDILLVCPYRASTLADVLPEFAMAGIPIVLFERDHEDMSYITAYIRNDYYGMGMAIGEEAAHTLDGVGSVVILQGSQGIFATAERQRGFLDAIRPYPDIRVAGELTTSSADLPDELSALIADGVAFDLIFAHTDALLLAAVEAASEAGIEEDLHFVGIDGQKEVLRLILDGVVTATVRRTGEFPEALDLALRILEGEPAERAITLPFTLVTEENAGSFYDPYSVF